MNWHEHLRYEAGQLYWLQSESGRKFSNPAGYLHKAVGYFYIGLKGKKYCSHRIIWEMHNGIIPDGYKIDHIDRNSKNNLIENLRLATTQENARNNSCNGFSWNKQINSFAAHIRINGKKKHLGCYSNIVDARAAYLNARRKEFGDFS